MASPRPERDCSVHTETCGSATNHRNANYAVNPRGERGCGRRERGIGKVGGFTRPLEKALLRLAL
eukprot:6191390-Pleurochrysis_carterae.AAC.1